MDARRVHACRRPRLLPCKTAFVAERILALFVDEQYGADNCYRGLPSLTSTKPSRVEPNSLHHEGFSRRTPEPQFARRAANPAARRPSTTRQSQPPHAAPSHSPETTPQPCEQVQPQAKAGCPIVEAHPRCTSRCLPHGRPTGEPQAERGCFLEDPPGLGRSLRKLAA